MFTHDVISEVPRVTRRHFFGTSAAGIGGVALGAMLGDMAAAAATATPGMGTTGLHIPPRAKRVIFLFQSGGPAQQDLCQR